MRSKADYSIIYIGFRWIIITMTIWSSWNLGEHFKLYPLYLNDKWKKIITTDCFLCTQSHFSNCVVNVLIPMLLLSLLNLAIYQVLFFQVCHISGTFLSTLPYIRYFFSTLPYIRYFFFQLCQFWFILSSSPWPTRPLHRPCFWSVQSDRSDFLRRLYFSSCLISPPPNRLWSSRILIKLTYIDELIWVLVVWLVKDISTSLNHLKPSDEYSEIGYFELNKIF